MDDKIKHWNCVIYYEATIKSKPSEKRTIGGWNVKKSEGWEISTQERERWLIIDGLLKEQVLF